MFFKRSSRIRFDSFDRYKKFEIWFEVLENNNVVGKFRIPSQVIINTFKDITLHAEKGYSDVIGDAEIRIGKDIREEMK